MANEKNEKIDANEGKMTTNPTADAVYDGATAILEAGKATVGELLKPQVSTQEAVSINQDYMRNSGPMWNPGASWAPYWVLHSTTENDAILVDDFKFNKNFLHAGDECNIHIISESCSVNYVNAVLTRVEDHELTFRVTDVISMTEGTLTITAKMLNDLTVKRQIHIYGRQPSMMANAVPLPYRPQLNQPAYGYHPFGCSF